MFYLSLPLNAHSVCEFLSLTPSRRRSRSGDFSQCQRGGEGGHNVLHRRLNINSASSGTSGCVSAVFTLGRVGFVKNELVFFFCFFLNV